MDPDNKLIAAVKLGDLEAARKTIAAGADIDVQDEQGWTALHWSAGKGNIEVVQFLLDHGADVAREGRDNRTPLMIARAAGRLEAAAALTDAEKARNVWKDPRENKLYCKGYYLRDVAAYSQWPGTHGSSGNGKEQPADDDSIVYLHQDLTVTKSVWPNENVIFNTITPEWIRFCESELKFSIPADLL